MKLAVVLAAAIAFAAMQMFSSPMVSSQDIPQESKEQPKEVVLDKDSQSDKYADVAFNHETHSTKNYSADGKAAITCVHCHHTDQPKSELKPPYVTSERDAVLTTALLADAKSAPVKSCRSCHLQAGDDSKPLPSITDATTNKQVKATNELAYHINCNTCHDEAIKLRPDLKGKIPGTNDCAKCHKVIG